MPDRPVYLVVTPELVYVAVYWQADSAELHARCITGARTQMLMVRDAVPAEILDDISSEDDLDEGWTPVAGIPEVVVDSGAGVVGSVDAGADVEVPGGQGGAGPPGPHRPTRPYRR